MKVTDRFGIVAQTCQWQKHADERAQQASRWLYQDAPAPFPLTLALSLREREQPASRSGKQTGLDASPRRATFTLSPRERAGVRGKTQPNRAANFLALVCGQSCRAIWL